MNGGDTLFAKVKAENIYGETELSTESAGVIYLREPDSPISVIEDRTAKTDSIINLVWTDGSNNGGTAIIDYRVSQRQQG